MGTLQRKVMQFYKYIAVSFNDNQHWAPKQCDTFAHQQSSSQQQTNPKPIQQCGTESTLTLFYQCDNEANLTQSDQCDNESTLTQSDQCDNEANLTQSDQCDNEATLTQSGLRDNEATLTQSGQCDDEVTLTQSGQSNNRATLTQFGQCGNGATLTQSVNISWYLFFKVILSTRVQQHGLVHLCVSHLISWLIGFPLNYIVASRVLGHRRNKPLGYRCCISCIF